MAQHASDRMSHDRLTPATTLGEALASGRPLSGLFSAYGEGDAEHYHYLLLLRFAVANLVGIALLAAAYLQGWIDIVLVSDVTRLSLVIAGLFVLGFTVCAGKVWRASRELNMARSPRPPASSRIACYLAEIRGRDANSRAISASALRLKLFSRIGMVRHTANSLVVLGLIGTVVGFIIALSGVRPDAAADPGAIGPMVSTLIQGMSVALYTTLVGAALNVWLMANYQMLATATANLVAAIVVMGERHANS